MRAGDVQIVIQLQKFAEAVKRIKGAVGSVNDKKAPVAKPGATSAYSGSDNVFGRDLSSILNTDLTGIDPSLGGQSFLQAYLQDKSSVAWCSGSGIQHAQHNSTGITTLLGGYFSLSYRRICLVVVLAVNIIESSMPSTDFMSVDS